MSGLRSVAALLVAAGGIMWQAPHARTGEERLQVLPAEWRRVVDAQTGAELLFVTTDPETDQALYYEQRSFTEDESVLLFQSSRKPGGLMGCLMRTGELVRLSTSRGRLNGATAARRCQRFFATRDRHVVEVTLRIRYGAHTEVYARERVVATLPRDFTGFSTALSENADGTLVAAGANRTDEHGNGQACVVTMGVRNGAVRVLASMPAAAFHGHVMFSRDNPHLLYYLGDDAFRTVLDARTGRVVFRHKIVQGEYATHHCWWKGDLITFCGGSHLKPTEDGDVKTLNVRTGEVRILGKGSWWPEARPIDLARWNWWHAAGDEQGRWVAADNWHGDIGLFHAVTTRTYILTRGHRTYGGGVHPEVGWDRKGEKVVFSSHMLGNVDVCVATIPAAWQQSWREQISGP